MIILIKKCVRGGFKRILFQVPVTDVVEFCSCAGEVKYFRLCTRDNDPIHYALVEFTEQPSVLDALKLNGTSLGSKFVK